MAEIKPLRTEADYQTALAEIQRLWGSHSGTAEGDRLDVLATLIDRYECEHDSIDTPDPIQAIEFRMEQQGLKRKDLEAILGSRSRVTEVLSRRRGLSINMIRRLHDKLGIATDVLMRPYRTEKPLPQHNGERMFVIRQLVYNIVSTRLSRAEFTRQNLIAAMQENHKINPKSIIPSDYLCVDAVKRDPSNGGNRDRRMTYPRFLERVAHNRYRFVGWDGMPQGSLDAPILRRPAQSP